MSGSITRPPMYQSNLSKKNIWNGEGVLDTGMSRIPVQVTEINYSNYDQPSSFVCEVIPNGLHSKPVSPAKLEITQVIYNKPATIVFWNDGTKTVVKCSEEDVYSPEVGLVTAIAKKFFGNVGNYNNELRKWAPKTYFEPDEVPETEKTTGSQLAESLAYFSETAKNAVKGLL